jgi:glycosyltransferase involved in cell wall biosynthesis
MNLPYFPTHGGANKSNRLLTEEFVRQGHTVLVVVPALGTPSQFTHAEWLDHLAAQGISVTRHSGASGFSLNGVRVHAVEETSQLRAQLVDQLHSFKPDSVLVSSEEPTQKLLEAAVDTCPSRVVYLVHTPPFLPFGPQAFYPSARRAKLLERVAAIISTSKFLADYIRQWGGLESTVIYMPSYGPGPFPQLGRFDDGFVTMVNPCQLKGIKVFLALARELPDIRFAAVPTWGTTDADRAALEGVPNIRVLEPRSDFDEILVQTRLLLMPSLWLENFPLTVIEAMLRGIPVLGSNVGGIPEAKLGTDFVLPLRPIEGFTDQLDGNQLLVPLVPEQDIGPWADALRRLLSDRELYQEQSAAMRAAALKFVSGLSVEPFIELFARLAADPASQTPRARAQPEAQPENQGGGTTLPGGRPSNETLARLSPEQRALLMLWLRKRAGEQSDPKAGAIGRVPRNGDLPLSFAQERLWFIHQLDTNSPAYNIPVTVRLTGRLDTAALGQSLNRIIERHEVLRTTFDEVNGRPAPVIAPTQTLTLPLADLSGLPAAAREAEVLRLAQEEARRPFDLARGPLLRVTLLRAGADEHFVLFTMHHIAGDGWSMDILVRETGALYEAVSAGKPAALPELPIQYVDFAHWQRQQLQGGVMENHLSYWKQQLGGAPAVLHLPTVPRPTAKQSSAGAFHPIKFTAALTDALKALSQQEDLTPFMTLLAAFQTVLYYNSTGQEDIQVGTPIANRNREETEGLMGFFISTVVLRTNLSGDPTFRELLGRVREVTLGAQSHQDFPFEKLVEALRLERDVDRTPLFRVWFVLQNAPLAPLELPGLTLTTLGVDSGAVRHDLKLGLWETPEGLAGSFQYKAGLFEAATIAQMAGHLEAVLHTVVAQPEVRLSNLKRVLAERDEQEQIARAQEFNEASRSQLKRARRRAVNSLT